MAVLQVPSAATLFAFGAALIVIPLALYFSRRDTRLDRVPGPRGNPITGIGLFLPSDADRKFRTWAKTYGEVYKIRVGWWNWVVLNSPETVKEVFDRQSISTSSKLPAPMSELVVGGMRMVTMPYGSKWRRYRALCHQLLTPKMTESFIPVQTQETAQLLHDLAHKNASSTEFRDHIHRTEASMIMKVVYGRRVQQKDDVDVKNSEESAKLLGKLAKGNFIEDMFPPLTKLPKWMQPSRKNALRQAEWVLWVKMRMWNTLKQQFAADAAPTCYAAHMLQTGKQHGLVDEDLAWIAGGLVDAGTATSTCSLNNLVYYLAATPEAQAKASDEIKRVIGPDRTPNMDDIPKLPYIFACVKEILRLCPVPPWSLRHFTDADVTCKDFIIPKGTAIVINTYALHFDPDRYPDPFHFKPERYLSYQKSALEYAAMADSSARDHYTFGSGRRMCPGARFAEHNLAFILANMLWAFEIRPPVVEKDGEMCEIQMDLSENAFDPYPLRSAKPFKARFLPRTVKHLEIIKYNWMSSQKN